MVGIITDVHIAIWKEWTTIVEDGTIAHSVEQKCRRCQNDQRRTYKIPESVNYS